jgi:spore maturation protein CgeB
MRHLSPAQHPTFFCSGRLTLNVTRAPMAAMGWCPSGRLFEAAACGTAILSDHWEGLDAFFVPDQEILTATTTEDTLAALDLSDEQGARIARAARERVLAQHTSDHRAQDFEAAVAMAKDSAAYAEMDA